MMTQITIDLPDDLVVSAQHLGEATEREVSEVLVDALSIILPTFKELGAIAKSADLSHLLDSEVIELSHLKMDAVQNQRLGELQAKGKQSGLTDAEGYELSVLMSIYQMGQLTKSQALAEAVKRGLRNPLVP